MSISLSVDLSHIEELEGGKPAWDQMVERIKTKEFHTILQAATAIQVTLPECPVKDITLDCFAFVATIRDALVLQDKEQIRRN